MPVLGSGLSAFPVLAAGGGHWTDVLAQPWLAAAGAVCAIAAIVWARAAARLARAARRIEAETLASGTSSEAANLARSGFNKDLHAAILYAVLAAGQVEHDERVGHRRGLRSKAGGSRSACRDRRS